MELIEEAKQCVNRALVESLAPGGFWQGSDWKAPSPLRSDSNSCDSFHIYLDGSDWIFKDFVNGEGGDVVKLVSILHAFNQGEAARWILDQTGHTPALKVKPGRKPKAPWCAAPADGKPRHPTIPIDPDLVTPYRLADKTIAYAILRWEKGARTTWNKESHEWEATPEKTVRPVYYTTEGKWVDGLPDQYKKSRLLLGLPRLSGDPRPVLILEGERKAQDSLGIVKSRLVTAWHGGADNAQHVDVSPIQDWPDLLMWPDHDEPGRKAALALKAKLPQLEILDVWTNCSEKPDGWDIADAIREDVDVEAFLRDCPRISFEAERTEGDDEDEEPDPFECIGYDRGSYWFLKGAQRIITQIDMGRFTSSMLGEIASPAWWARHGALNDKGSIDVTKAQQIIIERQTARGFFRPEILRGAGVWLEEGRPIINDGDNVVDLDGQSVALERYKSSSHNVYIRSLMRFDSMEGEESTPEEGERLFDLFEAQEFIHRRDAIAIMGFSLIAPFGGVLPWRPIAWLLGKTSNGKSWLIDNVILSIAGQFRFRGSKTTSEASIRRATNMVAVPVILDEQTPKTKPEREWLSKRVELAKNSSGDSSGYSTLASGVDDYVVFVNRSPFLFAGTHFPETAAEIQNRSVICELKPLSSDELDRKITASTRIFDEVMGEPARYRRRIFRALPRILDDIKKLEKILPPFIGGKRQADVWAPLLAATWAAMSDDPIEMGADSWLLPILRESVEDGSDYVEDEDRVVEHILGAMIESDDKKRKTVAEWLDIATRKIGDDGYLYAEDLLARFGLRVASVKGRTVIAIATRSDALARLLRDTPYEAGYDAQIKRNQLCLNRERTQNVRLAGSVVGCRLLDWQGFRKRYMEEAKE